MAADTPSTPADAGRAAADRLLEVENLQTVFHTERETIRAVDGVSFGIGEGETLGLVGESGSGKSVTARSIMGLVDDPGELLPGSSVRFDGRELTGLSEKGYEEVRGSGIAMVFQDPLSTLNPVYTVGNQIEEALELHRGLSGIDATQKAIELLEDVGIPDAARRVSEYPHEFSGGMRQRAVIAMALACDPEVLVCDEPTTALDVTIQAQILELLDDLQDEHGLSILFITHDMGVIAEVADRVAVMYAGEVVEQAPVETLYENPRHPYTEGLLRSIPSTQLGADRLETIEGEVPTPNEPATDCRFAPRCPKAFDACEAVHPVPVPVEVGGGAGVDAGHTAACLLYPEDEPEKRAIDRHAAGGEGGKTPGTAGDGGGDRR
ncbi:ABC transporter ATP-binding protein [Halolamina litorea]|uniref:Nickel import system ATP-binding protein NikD n=1 Tax=Halolamina litorea TaxID=1515593 RepID=A0ABD6BSG4_9EURY|nr:ABC transporter ATP-binding protein [Halolamina litorea]